MPSKRIEPTPFKPEPTSISQARKPTERSRTLLIAFTVIAFIGIYGVFIWLPDRVSIPDHQIEFDTPSKQQSAISTAPNSVNQAVTKAELSPFEQAQLDQARKAAQDVLEQLLLEQNALLGARVDLWANHDYEAAIDQAKQGDQSYRERDFEGAIGAYETALVMLTDLSASIPARVKSLLTDINEDLENFQLESARTQLKLLDVLAPEHEQIESLRQRVNNNRAAKTRLDEAKAAASNSRWSEAKELINQAATLDPQHLAISRQAAVIENGWQASRFQAELSAVYQAIARNDFDAAKQSIDNTAKYQGDASALEQAKIQLAQARSTYRLGELAELAGSAVDREDWHRAQQYYEDALKIDPAVQYALSGLPRAQARAKLHDKLEAIIAQPNRLEDIQVATAVEALIENASAESAPKEKLEQQINSIRDLLAAANQEIPVILTSDGLTELTIVRHMRLGKVERLETRLRPGEYTFRGTRIGYRDTLKTVRIEHNSSTMNLHIVCTETI